MKRVLLTTILGIAASAATTFGQGHVLFSTYVGTTYQPVKYANPVGAGHAAGDIASAGFSAELYYGLGSGVAFGSMTALPSSITALNTTTAPGYIVGSDVVIPNYSSGPITFAIVAFNGTGWKNGTSTYETLTPNVQTWTELSIQSTANPVDPFQVNVPAITVSLVPEPSTFALAGLGSAALLIIRRRK